MADEKEKLGLDMLRASMEEQRKSTHHDTGAPHMGFMFAGARLDVNMRHTQDITPEAGRTMVEVARQSHAIPAQERTKQEAEHTRQAKQVTLRHALVVAAAVFAIVAILINKEAGAAIVGVMTVLGGVYGVSEFIHRDKTKQLPPKGAADHEGGSASEPQR